MEDKNKYLNLYGLKNFLRKFNEIKADIDSPEFTGTPTAPTVADTDNSTKIATTEFVKTSIALATIEGIHTIEDLDNHTNALIDSRLGEIENGSY